MARTLSPTRILEESPNAAGVNVWGFFGFNLIIEMSVSGSVPISSASTSSRFHKVQNIRWP
jgi:hypothetical protein